MRMELICSNQKYRPMKMTKKTTEVLLNRLTILTLTLTLGHEIFCVRSFQYMPSEAIRSSFSFLCLVLWSFSSFDIVISRCFSLVCVFLHALSLFSPHWSFPCFLLRKTLILVWNLRRQLPVGSIVLDPLDISLMPISL
jgi:hypothetical protein